MGILNAYERISDTILTQEGRRQLAAGTLRFSYASFSDVGCVYETPVSGTYDAGAGVGFEAASFPHDTIVLESDDSGGLSPAVGTSFAHAGFSAFSDGDIVDGTDEILALPGTNFGRLGVIGRMPDEGGDEDFSIAPAAASVVSERPAPVQAATLPALFEDPDMAGSQNFAFMPPVGVDGRPVGNYRPRQLPRGKSPDGPVAPFAFDPRPSHVDSLFQAFETVNGRVRKMATIKVSDSPHTVLVGWLVRDKNGTERFVRVWKVEHR